MEVALGLYALGCRHGDKVAIISETRPEWSMVDIGALSIGAIVVGVYPTLTAEQLAYILRHSESRFVLIENRRQLEQLRPACGELALAQVVLFDEDVPLSAALYSSKRAGTSTRLEPEAGQPTVSSLLALRLRGAELRRGDPELELRCLDRVQADDVATLVYTSGTTGPPKGVVLTHGNLYRISDASNQIFDVSAKDVGVVFLPLAHSLQRVASYAGLWAGATGYFSESLLKVPEAWQAAQPTVVSSVPRIFEKMHTKIMTVLGEQPAWRRRLFHGALELGRRRSRLLQAGKTIPPQLALAHAAADRIIFRRLRARIFGRRVRFLVSGGAPISKELLEFFHALGLLILEGYGLTETSAPATINRPDDYRFGSVGKPLPGVEIKLADDGEVLIRGPGVFREYYKDAEATAAALDASGWFRSGDIGEIDGDGYLSITDRKKDIIITAAGKNIAPQNIENLIKRDPLISQVMVHGDQRHYLVALVTLDPDEVAAWAARQRVALREPGRQNGSETHPALVTAVGQIIDRNNSRLARFETVKKFRLLKEDFTVENGMLTPTLKVKRRVIAERYRNLLDEMYHEG
jgi:long-chain acyl-CoA synthetase